MLLIREKKSSRQAVATFDYSDLNGYLLLVVGLAHPNPEYAAAFEALSTTAQEGKPVTLQEIMDVDVGRREDLVTLPEKATLPDAMKILASGIHRIIVVKEGTHDVVSVLSQLRLVRFSRMEVEWARGARERLMAIGRIRVGGVGHTGCYMLEALTPLST